ARDLAGRRGPGHLVDRAVRSLDAADPLVGLAQLDHAATGRRPAELAEGAVAPVACSRQRLLGATVLLVREEAAGGLTAEPHPHVPAMLVLRLLVDSRDVVVL